nr:MAG TPA: hypothetical protein [Caudoviricetes sp.]
MSRMLSKMNLISVVQKLPKEDIETIQGYVEMIEEKNQELKKQLHEASIKIQEMTEQDIECPSNCDKLRKLNKQLEEVNNFIKKCGFTNIQQVALNYCGLLTQQKEFIKYLEDEIKKQKEDIFANSLTAEDIDLYIKRIKLLKMEEILQKYKETIGVSDEKEN